MPRYGFNFLWLFSKHEPTITPQPPDERALDFLAEHGLDFVRIPTDYRFWTRDFRYAEPDAAVLAFIDKYLAACRERKIHMCLNIHRAPGYCINRNDLEKHDLWSDAPAQDGFTFLWEMFARRYKAIPPGDLSFDLLNEPPGEGWDMAPRFTRAVHEKVMRRVVAAIRAVTPDRPVVLDGINAGGGAIPELADLGVTHSGRGYAPMEVTHHQASWTSLKDATVTPTWPLTVKGRTWDKDALREYYAPWRAVESRGVTVHIGEFGCFNRTPNAVALAWFKDLLSLYHEFKWGYSLWNFEGSFGIVDHGRPGAKFENYRGRKVDRALLDLYLENRV